VKSRENLTSTAYTFGDGVIDNWNSLSTDCVYWKIINTFKNYLSPALESGAVWSWSLDRTIVGNIRRIPALSVAGVGEFGELISSLRHFPTAP